MTDSKHSIWHGLTRTLLVIVVAVDAGILITSWMVNAESVGAHDMGWALSAAFWSTILTYASLGLAALALVTGLTGLALRLPTRWVWISAVLALVPGLPPVL